MQYFSGKYNTPLEHFPERFLFCHEINQLLQYYSTLWHVKRERAPIAVNRLDCAAYEQL